VISTFGQRHFHYHAFLIPDGRNAEDALAAFDELSDGYQASVLRAPWFRRRQAIRVTQ